MRNRPNWVERLADRLERALRFPVIGLAVALGIAMVSARVLWLIVPDAYYVYYVFPRVKDAYIYPELRHTFGQLAIFVWCLLGLISSILLFGGVALKRDIRGWTIRSLMSFVALFVVLVLGIVAGGWLRDLGG
jgi:hypothetical protein